MEVHRVCRGSACWDLLRLISSKHECLFGVLVDVDFIVRLNGWREKMYVVIKCVWNMMGTKHSKVFLCYCYG